MEVCPERCILRVMSSEECPGRCPWRSLVCPGGGGVLGGMFRRHHYIPLKGDGVGGCGHVPSGGRCASRCVGVCVCVCALLKI